MLSHNRPQWRWILGDAVKTMSHDEGGEAEGTGQRRLLRCVNICVGASGCMHCHHLNGTHFSHFSPQRSKTAPLFVSCMSWNHWTDATERSTLEIWRDRRGAEGSAGARMEVRKDGRREGGREQRPKREIVTTELVAGADFFHHLPCAARKTTIDGLRESQS